MKRVIPIFISIMLIATLAGCRQDTIREKENSVISGPYFGQSPPGNKPELFAPGIISTGMYELNSVFFPDGKEVIWSVRVTPMKWMMVMMKEENGIWGKPYLAPFNGEYGGVDPTVSFDGNRIYYCSNQPVNESDSTKDYDIWYVDRTQTGWSEPVNLGSPVNTDANEFYPSLTKKGDLYFQSWREGGNGPTDIYKAVYADGTFGEVAPLPYPINGPGFEGDAMIAPDESYIIVSTRRESENYGQSDLYISFLNEDGSWGELQNLGSDINSYAGENCQTLSPCGKYLFFTSRRSIPVLKEINAYQDLVDLELEPGNGQGDIYWVSVSALDIHEK
jgi:hypothetical protein